nr:hypothetical protein [Tanacetum cinerariifolium]
METCATLTQKVANLEQDKIAQALEITKLKQRVRRLKKKRRTKHFGLKRGMGIGELDANKDVTLVDVDAEVAMDTNIQGRMVVTTTAPITIVAQVPMASAPRKRRGVVIQDPEETAASSVIVHIELKPKDKGKGILIEEPKPLKRQA